MAEHAARFEEFVRVIQRRNGDPTTPFENAPDKNRQADRTHSRDIEIFKLLGRYRYLRSTYIHAFVGGASETRFKERLGDLFHEGYLDRPSQQWEFADARHTPVVHESGRAAVQALRASGMALEGAMTLLADSPHRQFLHSLMICEALASLDLGIRATPGLRLIGWPEILGRAHRRPPAHPRRRFASLRLLVAI